MDRDVPVGEATTAPGRVADGLRAAVGIVHYHNLDDLGRCLDALAGQQCAPVRVRVYDVVETPEEAASPERSALSQRHPDVEWLNGDNVGFAAAANRLLAAECGAPAPADVQLILNADIALDPEHLARLLPVFSDEPDVAIAGGKLLRPGRELIDSAGIRMPAHARPRDVASELPDTGEWDAPRDVFAVSGAALAVRTAALERLALDGEIFDERFFMYHEDTDLCWRAARLGRRVRYVPGAVAVHRRGWRKDERFQQPVWIRRHSFKNHYLQLLKNETAGGFVRRLPALTLWEGLRLGFAVLRDPGILPAYGQALAALPDAWRKRRLLRAKIRSLSAD